MFKMPELDYIFLIFVLSEIQMVAKSENSLTKYNISVVKFKVKSNVWTKY